MTAGYTCKAGIGAGLIALAALGGCATTNDFSAQVTTFQQWPAEAHGQTYRFANAADASQTLEQQSYRQMIADALTRVGLVAARPWDRQARFEVSFSYGSEPFQSWDEVPMPFYGAPMFSFGHYGYRSGFGFAFPFGGYGPSYATVPITAYRETLDVSIRDTSQNAAQVFQASATRESARPNLPRSMPYLVEAVFTDFPYGNGQVRQVRIPMQR